MGEVFRATDTRLHREVAVKVSSERFNRRFQSESRAIAALNHPNICTLYDVGPDYLVMELVEGRTLAERIRLGAIPIEEVLSIGRQIAEALEAAHERGIVHRDLKPANIKVTPDGRVKVLDFGLAKALGKDGLPDGSSTITEDTEAGAILGTAPYMSPEQAQGLVVDKRTDIWSYGVVFWEMLTGQRLFQGSSFSGIVADVLRREIEFDRLSQKTPLVVRTLIQRCLERDAKKRLRDIGEARIAIDRAAEHSLIEPDSERRSLSRWGWMAAVAFFALLASVLAWVHFRGEASVRTPQRVQFEVPLPARLARMDLSPDGKFLSFLTDAGSSASQFWVRPLDRVETRLLLDVYGLGRRSPFWCADGENIGFWNVGKLYKISRNGGARVEWMDFPIPVEGGLAFDEDTILLGTQKGLFRVSSNGRSPAVKIVDEPAEDPAWLPNRRFLYRSKNGVFAASLDGGKAIRILTESVMAKYIPPELSGQPGNLIFVRARTLWAQPFDGEKLELRGEPIPVGDSGRGQPLRLPLRNPPASLGTSISASLGGVLALDLGKPVEVVLTWLDRAGRPIEIASPPFQSLPNQAIRLSPDDSKAILQIVGENGPDLWVADLKGHRLSRFTFNGSASGIWAPDGQKILWAARDGNRYARSADGTGEDVFLYKNHPNCPICFPTDWASDGKLITFAESPREDGSLEVWLAPTSGNAKPFRYLPTSATTYWGQFSPDSRWMVYGLDQAPLPSQIFVESIPSGKGRWQISTQGGDWPIWRRDGKELFYRQGTWIMAVPIRLTANSVESGTPQKLFEVHPATRFQVSRDGKRFLIALPSNGGSLVGPITIDTDWRARLRQTN